MLKVATKFTPAEDPFETACEAGCRFAEFWLDATLLDNWKEIARLAKQYPLGYALHFPNRGDLEDSTLQCAVHLYRELGCSAMVIHKPMFRRYSERLLEFEPTLRLGVENHRLDPKDFNRWASKHTWLTLDVEHLWMYTLKDSSLDKLVDAVGDLLEHFGDKLVHVHMPGYVPGCEEHRPMFCNRDMVQAVLTLLADHSFDGLIVSEVNPQYQNVQELQMDVLLFQRWQELRAEAMKRQKSASPRVA